MQLTGEVRATYLTTPPHDRYQIKTSCIVCFSRSKAKDRAGPDRSESVPKSSVDQLPQTTAIGHLLAGSGELSIYNGMKYKFRSAQPKNRHQFQGAA